METDGNDNTISLPFLTEKYFAGSGVLRVVVMKGSLDSSFNLFNLISCFDPEDGSDMFLTNYIALYPRR
jgi:hypothetical protein